ncbi:AI-2E family transporter [Bacillus haynesii]|uniref:AI-2E family transporter n=1 Tax=Bacillus haynesii TaxID=1925021 RepID=UPI00227EFF0E|nr:AI-2E family transporter [Bacillus haynesii]MCY7752847.1 AI-2E family transporter [Bacillus haynesii]MCY8066477.1 AI-2E family transporter [Bacillus haynesii]MCY8099750.1 AI-2E family transporter [Bacillus haynesii]MCY8467483.1 AI-2E family transporter [Bacillus haynesii]MCY9289110.1 AI-2E family transporter [Bacillus haynesii]
MLKSKTHFWTLQILLVLLIIYVSTKVSFLFEPIIVFASTLFTPILIAGILYFIFNPIVRFLEKKLPRTLSILLIYLVFVAFIGFVLSAVGPVFTKQVTDLFNSIPSYVKQIQIFIKQMSNSQWFTWIMNQDFVSVAKIESSIGEYLTSLPENITGSLSSVFGVVTNIALTAVTVPFILFYMLKDGHRFPNLAVKILPEKYKNEGLKIFKDLYETLAAYIQGQLIVCLFVGTACFIGFWIAGVKYALILGLIIAVTNIIPYVGPFLGATPAVIIAFLDSPTKAFIALIIVVAVQQTDGNLLSPLIIGRRLNTHPLTIILLLIGAGSFGGILGMILAVPAYALLKAFTLNIVRLVRLRQRYKKETAENPEA